MDDDLNNVYLENYSLIGWDNLKFYYKKNEKIFWAIGAFCLPILLIFILDLGIIFSLANFLGVGDNFTTYLAELTPNDVSVEILVGVATIFIVFFAFLQLSYSLEYIPPTFVKKYLLRHKYTIAFISFFFSLLFILSIFSAYHLIYHIHQLIIIASIPLSVGITIWYFHWFTEIISVQGMVNCILEEMPISKIVKIETDLAKKRESFYSQLSERKNFFKISQDNDYEIYYGEGRIIKSISNGIIRDIDVKELEKIFDPIRKYVESIEFNISVGEISYENMSTLLKVNIKTYAEENTKDYDVRNNKVMDLLFNKEKNIHDCYRFDEEEFNKINVVVQDIITAYGHVATESQHNLDDIVIALNNYIYGIWKGFDETHQYVSGLIRSILFKNLIEGLDTLMDGNFSESQIKGLIRLLYAIKQDAIRLRDRTLFSEILNLIHAIHFQLLVKNNYYSKRIPILVLHIKELTFSYQLKDQLIKDNTSEDFIQKHWNNFYKPVFITGLSSATNIIYRLISFGYIKHEDEIKRYLQHNVDTLITFYNDVKHWDEIPKNESEELMKKFFREAFYVSIFIFRCYYYKGICSPQIVQEIGLRLAYAVLEIQNKAYSNMDDFCNEIIFDYGFRDEASFHRFEEPDFITTATHVGGTPMFDSFWITFSIFRNLYRRNYTPPSPGYFPTAINQNQKDALETLINNIDKIDKQKIVAILRNNEIDEQTISEELNLYKDHLEKLAKNNKSPVVPV